MRSIDNKLFQRGLDREPILWEELRSGADRDRLRNEVEKARLLIRDALDREEWPLTLHGWGITGAQVALKWEDVAAVEEEISHSPRLNTPTRNNHTVVLLTGVEEARELGGSLESEEGEGVSGECEK
ncbi:hypothetical protein BDZ45DRAFT_755287 [Acephala macrosclerotiorum]|nr:hypothetical protein BDZ45DRAFT_755287 [Acephala macrosclerotiorum]